MMQTGRMNFRQEFISKKSKMGFSVNDKSIAADFLKQGDGCTTKNRLRLSLLPAQKKIVNIRKGG